jgi:hypothetical protein
MNDSKSLGVLATLRETTALLAGLDLTTLPPIAAVVVHWETADTLGARVQLSSGLSNEVEVIDAIRTWAVALRGVVLLGDAHYSTYSRCGYRQLSALVRLPSGSLFEVWAHLLDLGPSRASTIPGDVDLIPA